jgi:hypothetical protein
VVRSSPKRGSGRLDQQAAMGASSHALIPSRTEHSAIAVSFSEKDGGPECRAKRNCVHRQRISFRPLPDMKLRHQVMRLVASSLFFRRSSSVQPISDRELQQSRAEVLAEMV